MDVLPTPDRGSEPAGAVSMLTFALTPLTSGTYHYRPGEAEACRPEPEFCGEELRAQRVGQVSTPSAGYENSQPEAKVTITGYALSNPSLARNRALSTADYLYARVKVIWRVVSVSTRSLNRVTVTTTAL